ncbi:hypothetical protein NOF04DRAFT_14208 [Fusarium oxysporum II5]|uniref:Uncharacterized protein n=3 Tax=Fusarium oxysporum species complex TaxID=171631 RepID=N1S1C4_FUSC4|nr:uncharacterized protein FOIG_13996 [Fusarium odoratissimum NRRL 54006]EMT71874.1 hypothetical protein FOC4_g10001466 [Fusarium odoratissimum]EXL93126.1 hypothetical protein FOIG_13996 [Fusarium odoratissimum NRRL 54006]KAK2134422.1 hypothetical protein NOF04DRAFT_14208 [Fusarium oxysporum II5]TXC11241.1 hypothetical protein FocTR4_00007687 [Fusarium oxysporum f. sp. cubense]
MADLMNKIKETLVPSNTENSNTDSHQESHNTGSLRETYNTSSHNTESFNNTNQNNQRELGSNSHISPLDATSNQNQQTEGVRTGDRIDSLVENVPGVPSSQSKPSNTPSYQNDMHKSPGATLDAARAPPSALKEHLGEPIIEHDYPHESSTKRHSSVSHQEEHYNLN